MLTALTAGVLSACAVGNDPEATKKEQGYSCTVTYDANGGSFGANSTRTYTLVKENSLTPAPGYVDTKTQASVKMPTRRNYELVNEADSDGDEETNDEAIRSKSWFLAQTDEKGNVIYEGEGENRKPKLLSTEPWDFVNDKVTGDITLVAMWKEVFRFSICISDTNEEGELVEKEFRTYTVDPGTSIVDKLYKKQDDTLVRRADYISVKTSGYTLLDFYLDDTYSTYLETDYVHPGRQLVGTETDPETGVETEVYSNTVTVYAKYLKGKYDFISNENIRTLTGSAKWYFLEDVDATGVTWESINSFKGEIYGNGFKLKNVTVTSKAMKPTGYKAHSIFGKIEGTIEDLTFDNVTMQVYTEYGATVVGEQRVNFLAYEFAENGALKNVTFQDCKISLKVLDDNQSPTLFEALTGENGGWWWNAPQAAQLVNVVMKANGETVTSVTVVQE